MCIVINKNLSSKMALTSLRTENELLYSQNPQITRESINDIKMYLTMQDKMSLIYLLFDDSQADTALQFAIQLVNKAPLDVLDEWILYVHSREAKWQFILLEALSVIHHYSALRTLGFSREEVNTRFLATNKQASLYIPSNRKLLYRMLETFKQNEKIEFLENVQKDFEMKNIVFNRYEYVEMYLLYWTSIKYISTDYLVNISRALKVMKKFTEADEFIYARQINEAGAPQELPCMHCLHCVHCVGDCLSSAQENRVRNSYVINPKCPGICLIINQQNFYIEYDNVYRVHPKNLTKRTGTDVDKKRLIETFTKLKYEVIVHEDLTHLEMREIIESVVQSVKNHSSLFICILSHGSEGKVYGANSIPIKIDVIKEIMCTTNQRYLHGKPKVLILQSCQTVVRQEAQEIYEQVFTTNQPPNTSDLFVFYATIPGYGAVRHLLTGAWFIQALCDKLDDKENLNGDFDNICTLVQGEITNKKSSRRMVPMRQSTLSKFLFLPRF